MAGLAMSDLVINQPLTTIANNYLQNQAQFGADKVFPVIPVSVPSGAYFQFNRGDWNRIEAQERAPGTESEGADFRISHSDIYVVRTYGLHTDLSDPIIAAAPSQLRLETASTEYLTQNLLLHREQKFANSYFKTGVWGRDRTGVAAGPTGTQFLQWNDANSDPINIIRGEITFIQSTQGLRPNVLVLGQQVYDALLEHPKVVDRMKYTQAGLVTDQLLASLLGVDRVVVLTPVINSAAEGATDAFGFMYGKAALLVYANPNASINLPSGGYIFAWTGYLGAQAFSVAVNRFRMDALKSWRIEAETSFDMQVVVPALGSFFTAAVA